MSKKKQTGPASARRKRRKKPPDEQCGGLRPSGRRCGRGSGWGTDHVGAGRCRDCEAREAEAGSGQNAAIPEWWWRYLSACLDWDVRATKAERCKIAHISRDTLWHAEKDPAFVRWLNEKMEEFVLAEHREVRLALLRKCISGDLEAIRLWNELYQRFIPTERHIVEGRGDYRDPAELSDAELEQIEGVLAGGDPEGAGPKVH